MTHTSIDISYAYARLGLSPAAPFAEVEEVLANALAYRFATRGRHDEIRRFVDFFVARNLFGGPELSFVQIRAAYHQRAKELHPDRNPTDRTAEEKLKSVNAAYETVDRIHREARDYFRQDEAARHALENEARAVTEREAHARGRRRAAAPPPQDHHREDAARNWDRTRPPPHEAPHGRMKFMAASVPRYIRLARLFYLPRHAVIGSRAVPGNAGRSFVYDIIMLPEREFMRARMNLGIEGKRGSPDLTMTRLTPAYIPIDTKMVFVPADQPHPWQFARDYFIEKLSLAATAA